MRIPGWMISTLAAPAFLAAGGCGGEAPPSVSSSMEEATVQGTVTTRGHVPAKARITFDPSNIHRRVGSNTATVNSDGTYSIKTLAGENSVTVTSPEFDKDPALSTNSQVIILKAGANTVPISL